MNRHERRAQVAVSRKGQGRLLAGKGPLPFIHPGRRQGYQGGLVPRETLTVISPSEEEVISLDAVVDGN